jgi:predicted RNase H-like HicB family nuclease
MRTRYYPAVIETDERGGYSIFFPDFPGCVSAGDTIDEVMANGEEALAGHIEVSAEHGDAVPEPSDLRSIEVDDDIQVAARVLVRADLPGESRPLSITLPEGLLSRIDRKAKALGYNRSAFLAEGARRMLLPSDVPISRRNPKKGGAPIAGKGQGDG